MTLEFFRGDANRPWRWMLAIDAVIAALSFIYQIFVHVPLLEYSQYLTTYHFGFVRRALVGSIIALFTDHVPISLVYIFGIIIWLITVALLVWSCLSALCGAAASFSQLLLIRVGVGVAEAGCSPPAA